MACKEPKERGKGGVPTTMYHPRLHKVSSFHVPLYNFHVGFLFREVGGEVALLGRFGGGVL